MEAQMPLMVANMLKSMGITQGSMQALTKQVHFSIYVIVEYVCIINVIIVFVGNDIHVTIGVYSFVCDLLWWWWWWGIADDSGNV